MSKSHPISLSLVAASMPLIESVGVEIGNYFLLLLGYWGWGVTIKKKNKLLTHSKFRKGMYQVLHTS